VSVQWLIILCMLMLAQNRINDHEEKNPLCTENTRLPHELIWLILEFYVETPKDLIRFACVCQDWRELSFSSVLWCRREMKLFSGSYRSLIIRNQRCLLDHPAEISQWYVNQLEHFLQEINDPNSLVRREERSNHRRMVLIDTIAVFATLLLIISGLCFGIIWRDHRTETVCYTIGFFSIYFFLAIALIAVLLTDHSPLQPELRHRLQHIGESRSVHKMTALLCLFLSISLSHYKLMTSHSSIQWVDVLIPLCFVVITLMIDSWKNAHPTPTGPRTPLSWRVTLKTLGIPFFLLVPPFLALFLSCYYSDYHQHHPTSESNLPYPPALSLLPLIPHLLSLGWFFISTASGSALGFCERDTIWAAFLSAQMRVVQVAVRLMTMASGAVGIASLVLFVLFPFPSRPSSPLFMQVNALFYLLLIFLCCLLTRFGELIVSETVLQLSDFRNILSARMIEEMIFNICRERQR
jgi:hypothetical protein